MNVNLKWRLATLLILGCGTTVTADESQPAARAAPAVGDALPAFESTDHEGRPWKSAEHVGKHVLVLYFYPGDFTGGCVKQAEAFRDSLARIEEAGALLVGVSGDEAATHALFKEVYGLKHSLLADPKGELAKLLGVPVTAGGRVRPMGPDRKPLLDAVGKPLLLERATTLARWTLVVGRDGKIASLRKVVNPVADAEEVLKIVAEHSKSP